MDADAPEGSSAGARDQPAVGPRRGVMTRVTQCLGFLGSEWWAKAANKQRLQAHVIIELPSHARVHSKGKIAELYRKGNSLREIEKQLRIPKTSIREALIRDGVEMRSSRNPQPGKKSSPTGMRSGPIPYGYTYLDGMLVIEPSEYKNILEIVRLREQGKSFHAIARTLNAQKARTRKRKLWTYEIIKRIILR